MSMFATQYEVVEWGYRSGQVYDDPFNYLYGPTQPWFHQTRMCELEAEMRYQARYWDPGNGQEYPLDEVIPEAHGTWPLPLQPEMKDWVLVLTRIL